MKLKLFGLALALSLTAGAAPDAGKPSAYAVQLPVVVAAGASLQRLMLPAQALTSLQGDGYADLRIFNAEGQALPMALSNQGARTEQRKVVLRSFPILGAPGMLKVTGLSLRVDEGGAARVVRVEGDLDNAAATVVIGALIDARAVTMPVVGLTLDADVPPQRTVEFAVEASPDLKDWRSIGSGVVYRSGGDDPAVGPQTIALDGVDVSHQYLRLTWNTGAGSTPVVVRGATLTLSQSLDNGPRVVARLAAPRLDDPHSLRFVLPLATPVAAVKVTPVGDNVVLPVTIAGRSDREQPWTVIGAGTVYRIGARGNGPFPLGYGPAREIRIEADARTPGFGAAPGVDLQFEPVQVVVLVTGTPPYTLAAGQAGVAAAYLPLPSLMPGYHDRDENALPLAIATVPPGPALLTTAAPKDGMGRRSMILWGLLLLGTAALGVMVWVLMRQGKRAETKP